MRKKEDFSALFPDPNFEKKVELAKGILGEFFDFEGGGFSCFDSPEKFFRCRVELGFFHRGEELFYASFVRGGKKIIYDLNELDFVDEKIFKILPRLLDELRQKSTLKNKLFGVEFLATKKELCATLLYHKNIFLIEDDLKDLSEKLGIKLSARSRGKKINFGGEKLSQELNIFDEKINYELTNECFIQPNTLMNERMIEWVIASLDEGREDLLELYCGYGNFTMALAKYFKKILASENSKENIKLALENAKKNEKKNIFFARLSSEEMAEALSKKRKYERLKNIDLKSFYFSHVLVDPPRAGLSEDTIRLLKNYEKIIYISCNILSLKSDLKKLNYKVKKIAFFDQFKHTPHLEYAVLLSKNI